MPRLNMNEVADLYTAGATIAELAERFNITHETLRRRMVEAKIPRRRRGPPIGKYRPADGRIHDKTGYELLRDPEHPNAADDGYVRVHRSLMAELLQRPLTDQEVVTFVNGDRADTRPENLRIYASRSEHMAALLLGNSRASGDTSNPRRRRRRRRSRTEMMSDLVLLRQTLGRDILRVDLVPPWPSWRALARQFGSWQNAVSAALGDAHRTGAPSDELSPLPGDVAWPLANPPEHRLRDMPETHQGDLRV